MLSSRTWRTCTPSNCWANFRAVSRRSWRIGLWGLQIHTAAPHPPLHAVAPIRLKHPRQTSKPTSQLGSYPTQKVIFASESNKNCLKYTFCLFPDHSIFQGTKKLDSPGFSSFQAQTQCSSNLPHLKSLRVQAFSASFKSRFASSQGWFRTPPNFEKMDHFLIPFSSFHLDNCDHFAAPQTHQARRAQPCVVPAPLPSLLWPPRSLPPPPRPAPAWHGWREAAQKRPGKKGVLSSKPFWSWVYEVLKGKVRTKVNCYAK